MQTAQRHGGAQRALSTIGARGTDLHVATLEGSSWRTVIECRPRVVFSACAMLFRFAKLRCRRFTRKLDWSKLPCGK
jgi:hypothetical protein